MSFPYFSRTSLLAGLAIAAASALCYANSLGNGFVFDDSAYIHSPVVRQFLLKEAFVENWRRLDLYRPLALVSLALDYRWHQEAPWGYHLTNLLLHAANGVLVFHLALGLLGQWRAALMAALFYAVHPVQTEVVDWVSARGDLLMNFFLLAGLLCHLRAEKKKGWPLVAWACYGGSLLAKESGIVLPAVAWWHDLHRQSRAQSKMAFTLSWARHHFGYGLVLAGILVLRWLVVEGGGAVSTNFLAEAPLGQRVCTTIAIFMRYLVLIAFPVHLSADYSHASIPLVSALLDPWFAGGALAVLGSLWLVVKQGRSLPGFALGFFWLALLPSSSLFFPAPSGMAERYVYPSMPAVALLLGLAGKRWLEKAPTWRWPGIFSVGLVLLLLAGRTVERNRDWQSDYRLFSSVLALYPNNALAHENLGYACYERGEFDQAIEHYRKAVVIDPGRVRPHYHLGLLYGEAGRYEQALVALETALRLNPGHASARYNLGLTLQKMGRHREAMAHYQAVLRLVPEHARAAYNLARAYESAGLYQEAIQQYQVAIGLDPESPGAQYHLGELHYRLGQYAEMEKAWQALLQKAPDHPQAARLRALLQEAGHD